ncbi:hypothetical protein HYW46_06505 [Candidatus Daviesbacteria bacterium]|nr:hypothetical protein [Candidatus Daviesbacteria bacterium]
MIERVLYESSQRELSPTEEVQPILEGAVYVIDMFDQANTNHAIENLGSRGYILKDAIERLRIIFNSDHQRTILDSEQAN